MSRRMILPVFLALALTSPLAAEVTPEPSPVFPWMPMNSLSTEVVVGFPLFTGLFEQPYPGVRAEYDFLPGPWGVELEYAFHSLSDYQFDHLRRSWSGPDDALAADWPFYQTRHVVAPGVVYTWRHGALDVKTALGILAQFTVPSEALDYYPEAKAAYDRAQIQGPNFLGNYWKVGAAIMPFPVLTLGADLSFEIPSWGPFLDAVPGGLWTYSRTHAHVELHLGVKL